MDNFITLIPEILGVGAAFVLAFDRLAKITPTQTDDKLVETAGKIFRVLGLVVRDR